MSRLKDFVQKHKPTLTKPTLPHLPARKAKPSHKAKKIKETKSLEETVAELNRLSNMADRKAS